MARPNKDESLHRGKRVYIRFTELEYELVAGYAKDAGYPIGTFVRKVSQKHKRSKVFCFSFFHQDFGFNQMVKRNFIKQ